VKRSDATADADAAAEAGPRDAACGELLLLLLR